LADNSGSGQRPKVATIERAGRLTVHDKELTLFDDPAPLPGWQWATPAITLARLSHLNAIDGNDESISANGLPAQGQNAFKHWNARGKVTIEIKENGERMRRLNGDEFGDGQRCRWPDPIQTDRNTVRGVPYVVW
jgi:hypothetical protein